jgi:hypothetical protein
MSLPVRPSPYILPSYSLTGDLISFMRCGLQYRYHVVGRLPSSNPVQMWFGQFIHAVLEESYRIYNESIKIKTPNLPPWSDADILEIVNRIERRLAVQGLVAWDDEVRNMGIERAKLAVNELGPDLFPLIHQAEVRLTGTRYLPAIKARYRFREANRYEVLGVVDVITHIQLHDKRFKNNRIVKNILASLPAGIPDDFEVIIDYKGMRRPPNVVPTPGHSLWDQYKWQIQTYAHLRQKQIGSLPVVAGALIYINELLPSKGDMGYLKKEIKKASTDVIPAPGTDDLKHIQNWRKDEDVPDLSWEFRLQRAMRVVPITEASIDEALTRFDEVVKQIETCHGKELYEGLLMSSWDANASEPDTCTACDARSFCRDYTGQSTPTIPAWKNNKNR